MGSYRHLSREDRDEIAVLRAARHSNAAIAEDLGRSPSTNLPPRKCLGYITPIQALFKDLGRDVRLRFA